MKNQTFRIYIDPILNEIVLNNKHSFINDLIHTKEFYRLGRIRQLGVTNIIFPSATHTRLSHGLGTYEITRRFINQLGLFKTHDYKAKHLLCAALLHDLGHGPNSHAFEKYTGINHEEYTKKIILDPSTNINKVLIKNKINPKLVTKILEERKNMDWTTLLIDSQIDADRMDYLMRDSWYTGAEYWQINPTYIIHEAKLINNKICFSKKAIYEIENLLLGRYHMYVKVYNHPYTLKREFVIKQLLYRVKQIYKNNKNVFKDSQLFNYLKPWFENKEFTIEQFLNLDDYIFSTFIESLRLIKDFIIQKLLKAYDNDDLVKIKECSNKTNNIKLKPNTIYEIVETKPTTIYKNNAPDAIYIYDNDNDDKVYELSKISPLIKKVANHKEQKRYLIYLK